MSLLQFHTGAIGKQERMEDRSVWEDAMEYSTVGSVGLDEMKLLMSYLSVSPSSSSNSSSAGWSRRWWPSRGSDSWNSGRLIPGTRHLGSRAGPHLARLAAGERPLARALLGRRRKNSRNWTPLNLPEGTGMTL